MAPRLSPTSYLVLGLVGLLGRATPYQLKGLLARSIGDLWSFPHSQLYAEPARLAELGLLAEDREAAGRHRRFYSLTDTGRAELRAWLADPSVPSRELRDVALLKLMFAEHTDPAHVRALACGQVAEHRAALQRYRELQARPAAQRSTGGNGSAVETRELATTHWGVAFSEAMLGFWTQVAEAAGAESDETS